jgi:glycosyltransferase involved in cell wall biosynthesis
MKVLISAPVNSVTGYGKDGIELVRAFQQWGADTFLAPSSVFPPLPRDVAAALTRPIPDMVDLLISHRCPQELAKPDQCGIWCASTVALAWTMWEWDSLDNVDELGPGNCEHAFNVRQNLKQSLDRFDSVLAYDEVSRRALEPYCNKISVLQGGVDPVLECKRDWFASPFKFLMAGALSTRKNPWAAIEAFKQLRDAGELADAELILKTTYPGLHPAMEQWCPGLKIIAESWSEDKLFDLYNSCHVLLAPSWGEGKNRPAIQFAMSGGAVVAPLMGGHAQWMSSQYTWPVSFEWKDFIPGVKGAKVSVDHLSEIMLDLYKDRASIRPRVEAAARVLPAMMNWDSVLERLLLRLPLLAGGRGLEVASLMRSCRSGAGSAVVRDSDIRSALDKVS